MRRGVVLGGGGIAGVAWEAGIVIGLRRAGVDLSSADVIVGTSAGSIVGSHVAFGTDLQALAAMTPAPAGAEAAAVPAVSLEVILSALAPLFDQGLDPREGRRRVGAAARAAGGDEQPFIARIASLLPAADRWPQRGFVVTAVDAESGEPVAWHRGSGVPLDAAHIFRAADRPALIDVSCMAGTELYKACGRCDVRGGGRCCQIHRRLWP